MKKSPAPDVVRFNQYKVEIPSDIQNALKNLTPSEAADIAESMLRIYSGIGETWTDAKFKPTLIGIEAELTYKKGASIGQIVLKLIHYKQYRNLNSPVTKTLLEAATREAIADNDVTFFKRLGRMLETDPVNFVPPIEKNPLAKTIIESWFSENRKGVQFCCFTDEALNCFLETTVPEINPTFDGVRSTRQRLKLRQMRKKLVRHVEVKRNVITLS